MSKRDFFQKHLKYYRLQTPEKLYKCIFSLQKATAIKMNEWIVFTRYYKSCKRIAANTPIRVAIKMNQWYLIHLK